WALDGRTYGAALGRGSWSRPSFRRRVARAAALPGGARTRRYARLARELMRAAPFAVYGSYVSVEYFSPRVRCKVFERAGGHVDPGHALHRQRGVGEQAACVPAAAAGVGFRPEQPKWRLR